MEEQEIITGENSLPPKITKESINHRKGSKKELVFMWTRTLLYTLLSSFLISVASFCLIAPNGFTIGGASGLAILVNAATQGRVPQWIVLFGINCPLVILAFFFVKRRFALLSTLNIGAQSLWLLILDTLHKGCNLNLTVNFSNLEGGEGVKIFAALAAGICVGTAIALAFKIGGSTGGADIVAVLIQKKCAATSIAWMLFIINFIIISCSLFVYRGDTPAATLLPIMMSAFEAYIESKTNESVTNGFQSAIEFKIVTDKPEAMAVELMKELSRGVTSIPATGMYTKITHSMLLCVVSRRQVATLRRIMKSVDPDSFAVMSKVSQVLGLGFYSEEM